MQEFFHDERTNIRETSTRISRNGGELRNNLDVRLRNNSGTRMINAFSIHLNAPLSPKRDIGAASMHRLIVQCLRIVAIVVD